MYVMCGSNILEYKHLIAYMEQNWKLTWARRGCCRKVSNRIIWTDEKIHSISAAGLCSTVDPLLSQIGVPECNYLGFRKINKLRSPLQSCVFGNLRNLLIGLACQPLNAAACHWQQALCLKLHPLLSQIGVPECNYFGFAGPVLEGGSSSRPNWSFGVQLRGFWKDH